MKQITTLHRAIATGLLISASWVQGGVQAGVQGAAHGGGELRFTLRADPKTLNPLLVDDEPSEQIRYLTGGVLVRVNRLTQQLDPELATKWKVSEGGRRIDFDLRPRVLFSDGVAFSCQDVVFTFQQLMDPAVHAPAGEPFRASPGAHQAKCGTNGSGGETVMLRFPGPIAALEWQFDQVAMVSSKSPRKEGAVLGPFLVADNRPGSYILLRKNPHYWKTDREGRSLPYLDSIRLDIQQNRETELLRFRRGQLDLISKIDPELFDRLFDRISRGGGGCRAVARLGDRPVQSIAAGAFAGV